MFWVLIPAACMFSSTALFAQDDEPIEEIITYGVSTGAKQAIGLQKQSATLVTIISEQTLDSLPDQSIGEILARLPGVGVFKDRGEAERIFIRGTDARLNAVTMNGDRLPSPESTVDPGGGQRHARMTTIPASLISEIRVYKAVPPNLDGDSIGGAVEFKTKSATQLTDTLVTATVRWGVNDLDDGNVSSAEFTFGDRLNDAGTFGMIVTASWEENNRSVEGIEAGWRNNDRLRDLATDQWVDLEGDCTLVADPAAPLPLNHDCLVLNSYDLHWRDLVRTRTGLNVTFDYKPSEDSIIKFGGFWSEFEDIELRRRASYAFTSGGGRLTTDAVFNSDGIATSAAADAGRVRKRVRPGTKTQDLWNAFVGGSTVFADNTWTLDWRLSNTFGSRNTARTWTRWEVRGTDNGFRGDGMADWSYTGGLNPSGIIDLVVPAWANDPDLLHVGRRGDYNERRDELSEDEIAAVKFDLSRSFDMANGEFELQFGYKGRFNERTQTNAHFSFRGFRERDFPDLHIPMSEALGANSTTPVQPFGFDNGLFGDQSIMEQIFLTQPERFRPNRTGDADRNYDIEEDIHAGYIMGTIDRGAWSTIIGVRYEDTETIITTTEGVANVGYDQFLPAIITRFQPTENWVIRGAWTNSLARPDFTDLKPFVSPDFEYFDGLDLDPADPEFGIPFSTFGAGGGNPDLQPFEAMNLDLSVEYYTDSGGVYSAGLFYKKIENFEFRERIRGQDVTIADLPQWLQDITNDAIADERLNQDPTNPIPDPLLVLDTFGYSRPVNGEDATLKGLELNFQQKFENLPAPWNNFGVLANYTKTDGESNMAPGISRDYIIGQYDATTNLQLFYETENYSARLAYNRNGIQYRSLGLDINNDGEVTDDPNEDEAVGVEYSVSLALKYNINNFTIFFDVNNLTDEPSAYRFFGSDGNQPRFSEIENVGRSFILGVNWTME